MEKSDIEKLRATPIVDLALRLGIPVEKNRCLCLFHEERTPSMSFSPQRNTYRCWACGAHGDAISLVMKQLSLPFPEACRWLANEGPGPSQPPLKGGEYSSPFKGERGGLRYFEHPYLNAEARRFLYEERRLSPSIVEWCRLSSWTDRDGICWLQIPYYSPQGQFIGMQARRLTPSDTQPRFRFPRGCRPLIYNQRILPSLRPDEELWIAEGITDCLALLSSGRKSIAIPSATLLTRTNRELLGTAPTRNWHMAPDQDAAGEMLYRTLLSTATELGASLTRHQLPQGCKDFADWWKRGSRPSPDPSDLPPTPSFQDGELKTFKPLNL